MPISKKEREDKLNEASIYAALARQRDSEYYSAHASVSRLYKTNIDAADFMHSDPNARITFAAETGILPG